MQTIKRVIPNIHDIFNDIDRFYAFTSTREPHYGLLLDTFDNSFKSLLNTFNEFDSMQYRVNLIDVPYEPLNVPSNDNNLILCFSGGKDSIASAIKFKESGYNVFLYSMKHINPTFSDEWKCAQESADILGLPIFFDDIGLSGKHDWMEHPMKNMVIACGAIQYGIRNGLGTRIAFGNYTTSTLEDNVFERCAGDCMNMWDCFNAIIQRVIPDFKVLANLENMGETLECVTPRSDLLSASSSCLCRHPLIPHRHNWVLTKFGVDLPAHRCGNCYKCCVEYIYMADHDLITFSRDYYRYCLNALYRVMQVENVSVFTALGIWNAYMFYPVTQSKIYQDILDARLFIKSIKWGNEHIIKK